MAYSITGKIKLIGEVQTFASGFSKREFVITTEEQYPQEIAIEALKDRAAALDKLKVGETVTVQFDIRGREYNGRYYVSLALWKIESGAGGGAPARSAGGRGKAAEPEPEDTTDYSVDIEEPF